jgi:hypothetical protein
MELTLTTQKFTDVVHKEFGNGVSSDPVRQWVGLTL